MKHTNYNIGIDIGTSSVGLAVTGEDGRLLKFKGKNMWSVNLFDEGETAKATRLYRSSRRRYSRRSQRIKWLQNLVSEDVLSADENFFARLKETSLHKQDSLIKSHYNLFDDEDFNEEFYYEKYPTIYHLRNELATNDEKADIRLVYLAMHHIIKYRGNFMYQGQDLTSGVDIVSALENTFSLIPQCEGKNIHKLAVAVSKIITNKSLSKNDQKKSIEKELDFNKDSKSVATNIASILIGSKSDIKKIFGFDSEEKDVKISLADEDAITKAEGYLDDDQMECFVCMQHVYSAKILSDLLNSSDGKKTYDSISVAMVEKYNKHQADLKLLKEVYRKQLKKAQYNKMFADDANGIYEKYIHAPSELDKNQPYDVLKKAILADLEKVKSENKKTEYIVSELEKENFLPKLNTKNNGAIPYQLHKQELEQILDNQGKYYPSIKENRDKILSILEFKIPYYIGPLSGDKSRFGWMIRQTEGKIYPWNFDDMVDKDKSAEEFIARMRNSCTYLPEADVIPKCSLLYTEYEVRTEIKQIKLDDHFMSLSLQNDLYEELFKTQKNIKEAAFRKWLKQKGLTPVKITGYQKDGEFATSLKPYIDFKAIFGKVDYSNKEMIENIIHWLTVFNEKEIIERKIKTEYPLVTADEIKKILQLKYTGWSRLSRELLTELKTVDNRGNYKSIMDYIRSTSKNFMQIINDKNLGFGELIEKTNLHNVAEELSVETVQNLYTSPANKKAIWQTILMIQEIEKIMGCKPANIFVEFSRSDEEKKRTKLRYNDISDKYAKAVLENPELKEIAKVLKEYDKNKKALDNRALYLYFLQNGKCLYTGKSLDINNLSLYEIDHIIPRSYIKDDSFDNLALVIKDANQRKGDSMLLDAGIRSSMHNYWIMLKNAGLMSEKKFKNLKRDSFDDRELNIFIARQLVETRQITKHVVTLLSQHYKTTNIVAIKASLPHNIREKYQLLKTRNINDYHHAYDALLACVTGLYIQKCYPYLDSEFNYGEYRKFAKANVHDKRSYGYVVDYIEQIKVDGDTGEVVWDGAAMLEYLRKVYGYKDCFISRKTEEQTDAFYNQTIWPKTNGSNTKLVSLKKHLPVSQYGGYDGVQQAYYTILEFDGKKTRERKLVGVPIYITALSKTKPDAIREYFEQQGYTNPVVIKDKIKKYQKIEYEGNLFYIVSDGEVCNARQLVLSADDTRLVAKLDNPKYFDDIKLEDIDALIKAIVDKMDKYYPKYSKIVESIREKDEQINVLTKKEKCDFVKALLIITKANSGRVDLSAFVKGLSTGAGRIQITLIPEKIKFINTSVTGMFEN